jgi:hypothetical protein
MKKKDLILILASMGSDIQYIYKSLKLHAAHLTGVYEMMTPARVEVTKSPTVWGWVA